MDERKKAFGKAPSQPKEVKKADYYDVPNKDVDWRLRGAVNPIQDQGLCGSCWAFSSVAAMEGAHAIKTGTLLKLSEQQFNDCDTRSHGCKGGLETWAFDYAENHAIELESDYPYTAKDGACEAVESKGLVKAVSYERVEPSNVDALLHAIGYQPTCVSVNAGDNQFTFYSGGILNSTTCGTFLDHAITAVGYGSENGQGYFIVRNSWGTSWGEDGYIRMSSDVGGAGVCGVLLDSVRPSTD